MKKIIWVIGVLRRTVVSDWRFDNLCRWSFSIKVKINTLVIEENGKLEQIQYKLPRITMRAKWVRLGFRLQCCCYKWFIIIGLLERNCYTKHFWQLLCKLCLLTWEGLRYKKVVILVMQSLYYIIIILMCNPGQFMQDVFVIIGGAFRCAIKPG